MILQVGRFARRVIELARKTAMPFALSAAFVGAPAMAQQTDIPPPKAIAPDPNGVDLLSGNVSFSAFGNSIGPKGSGSLSSNRIVRANLAIGISAASIAPLNSYVKIYEDSFGALHTTMALLGQSQNFYGAAGKPGITPEYDAVGTFNNDATNASGIIYTAPDGAKAVFVYTQYNPLSGHAAIGRLRSITYPTGEVVTYGLNSINAFTYKFKAESSLGYALISDTTETDPIVGNLAEGNCDNEHCAVEYASQYALSRTEQIMSAGSGAQTTITVTSAAGDGARTYTMGAVPLWNGEAGVSSVTRNGGTWTYTYSYVQDSTDPDPIDGILTVTVTDPNNVKRIVKSRVSNGHVISDQQGVTGQDPVGRQTTYGYQYDGANTGRPGFGRLSKVTMPGGDAFEYTYGVYDNIISRKHIPKTGSSLSATEITASYSCRTTTLPPVTTICNQPDWIRDENGKQTDFTYYSTNGLVETVTLPARPRLPSETSDVRPQTRYFYTQVSAYYIKDGVAVTGTPAWRVLKTSACRTQSSCAGTSDELVTDYVYESGTSGYHNARLTSVTTRSGNTAGAGAISATTTYAYNPRGDVIEIDGPLAGNVDLTQTRYDASRWLVGTVGSAPGGGGSLLYRASKTAYRADGQVSVAYTGVVADRSDATFANSFQTKSSVTNEYDSYARVKAQLSSNGTSTYALTETSYDTFGRVDCVAVRMDTSKFGNRLAACSAGANGTNDPDRITKMAYDKYGRVESVRSGYDVNPIWDRRTSYTLNDKVETEQDGADNLTSYTYDGLDRLQFTYFPNTAKGTGSNSSDYEQLGYDPVGNVTSRRLRGTPAVTITSTYDNLNRLRTRTTPAGDVTGATYTYDYDNFGRPSSTTDATRTVSQIYDALGRMTSETSGVGILGYEYDAAGRRTKLTWPDSFYVTYEYDNTGALTAVRRAGSTAAADKIAGLAYDDLGRRVSISRGATTAATSYVYNPSNLLLSSIAQAPTSAGDSVTYSFAYNVAGQVTTRTISNGTYVWNGAYAVNRPYTLNGLNQVMNAGTSGQSGYTIYGYDGRGNLICTAATPPACTGPSVRYIYDAENRLRGTTAGAALVYDPLGRLYSSTTVGNTTTRYLYDGVNLVGEYNDSNVVQRRYVFGTGADEVLAWFDATSQTEANAPRWLLADHQGSIIASLNASGSVATKYTYDEYGVPGPSNVGLFQYTGQVYLSDLSLYHYKARAYSPTLGRFLQTDPTGYDDGLNWYAYVGNDPLNKSDPTGLDSLQLGIGVNVGPWRFSWGSYRVGKGQGAILDPFNSSTGKYSTRGGGLGLSLGVEVQGQYCKNCTSPADIAGKSHAVQGDIVIGVSKSKPAVDVPDGFGGTFDKAVDGKDAYGLSFGPSVGLVPIGKDKTEIVPVSENGRPLPPPPKKPDFWKWLTQPIPEGKLVQ